MKIHEITDIRSKAIYEYIKQLTRILAEDTIVSDIKDWKYLNLNSKDVSHFHYSNSTVLIIFSLLLSKNCFVTIHDVLPRNNFSKKYFSQIIYRLLKFKSRKIIVHSEYAKRLLLSNFKFMDRRDVQVIPYGTDPKLFSSNEYKKARDEKDLKQSTIVLLYVGYIKKSKGIIETTEAFKKIQNNNIRLVFIGKIVEEELNKYISEVNDKRIKFIGYVSNEELHKWNLLADCLVNFRIDSVGETSASVINALNYGKPIIATDVGSNKEVIQDAGLFSEIRQESINELIYRYIHDEKLRIQLSNSAIKRRDALRWSNYLPIYRELFQDEK